MTHNASMPSRTMNVDEGNAGGNLTATIYHAHTEPVPRDPAMRPQSASGAPATHTAKSQVAKPPLRLSAVKGLTQHGVPAPLSMMTSDINDGPLRSPMSVEDVRAAQALAQSTSLAGSDESSGLPQPLVKRQAAGEVHQIIAPRNLASQLGEQIVQSRASFPGGDASGIVVHQSSGVVPERAAAPIRCDRCKPEMWAESIRWRMPLL